MTDSSSAAGNGQALLVTPGAELGLRDISNFLLRNRLFILIFFVVGLVTAAFVSLETTPLYEAVGSVNIEDAQDGMSRISTVLGPELAGASPRVETEMGVLKSRALRDEVVDSLSLMLRVLSPRGIARNELLTQIHVEPWVQADRIELTKVGDGRFAVKTKNRSLVDTILTGDLVVVQGATFAVRPEASQYDHLTLDLSTQAKASGRLKSATRVTRPDRLASIVELAYRSTDTILVDDVPNLMSRLYIRRRLQSQQTAASSTVAFLRGQIDSLSLELTHAEDALQAYREGQQVVALEAEATAQINQLARLQADRNSLDAERGALQQLMDGITREAARDPVRRGQPSPYRRLIAFPSLLQNQAASNLLQTLNTIENQRSELLRRRTTEDPDVLNLTERIEALEEQLRSIATTYLQGLSNQVTSLDRTLDRFGGELSRIPAKELAVARLERRTGILKDIYMLLETRLKEAQIAQAAEDPAVRVLDGAVLTPTPVRPRPWINIALGALLGLLLGVSLAAAKDVMDRTIHTRQDMEDATGGMPLLAVIPSLGLNGSAPGMRNGKNGRHGKNRMSPYAPETIQPRLIALIDPNDPVSEAYRALRTSIRFSRMGEAPKTIVITSALPQDGKSTTASNLAITLAQQGLKTLLIDGDLRKGVIANLFGLPSRPGLSNVLIGDVPLRDVLRNIEVSKGVHLHVLTAGSFAPNPAEIIGSERMAMLLRKLEESYDAILVDTAPLNLVTDAAVVGVRAGGVILVTRAARTDRNAVRYAADRLRGVGAVVLGAVLNDVVPARDGLYGSGYGSYHAYSYYRYGNPDKDKKGKPAHA